MLDLKQKIKIIYIYYVTFFVYLRGTENILFVTLLFLELEQKCKQELDSQCSWKRIICFF